MRAAFASVLLVPAVILGACAIGGGNFGYGLGEGIRRSGSGALSVRWHRSLTPSERGAYVPVETAVGAIDETDGSVYVPSVQGSLYAFTESGERRYRLDLGVPMESEPALDVKRDELYFGTERSQLVSLVPSRGEVRFRVTTSAAVRRRPALSHDAVFVVTESDVVEAFSRNDGSLLWRYARETGDGFLVAGHAGLTMADDRLYAAFNDGAVVCLDILDGRERWTQETARDAPQVDPELPKYLDVDTTPLVHEGKIFVASFAAGLYALDVENGSVVWRMPTWTGIVGVSPAPGGVIVSSADRGVANIDAATQKPRWVVPHQNGTASAPRTVGRMVMYGESQGSFVALDVVTGEELSRVSAEHGFEALPAVGSNYAYVLTNGGMLLALRIAQ